MKITILASANAKVLAEKRVGKVWVIEAKATGVAKK